MRLSIVLAGLLAFASCSQEPQPSQTTPSVPSAVSALAKMGELATDPIAQFSLSFDGNPPQDQIQEKLDGAMRMYGLELTNENWSRAGNALVALRKEKGHSEMAILDKMLSSSPSGTFEEAAGRLSSEMSR